MKYKDFMITNSAELCDRYGYGNYALFFKSGNVRTYDTLELAKERVDRALKETLWEWVEVEGKRIKVLLAL